MFWDKKIKWVLKPTINHKPRQEPTKVVTRPKSFTPPSKPEPTKTFTPKSKPAPTTLPNYEKEFLRIFKTLCHRHRSWDIWKDFITMFACSLSNTSDKSHYDEREALYMRTIKKYPKQEQTMFPDLVAYTVMALDRDPEQDFLGKIYMDLNLSNTSRGQFFTPYDVCELIAKVSMGDDVIDIVEKNGYITIHDPCCGSGSTLIAGIQEVKSQLEKVKLNYQNHILVAAQEIDYTTALMCYIQLSLLGVAGYVKIENALTKPISRDDTSENYWFTPMYFFDIWITRRLLKGMSL